MREKEIRPANKILIIIISLLAILATLLWINYILIKPNTVATVQTLEEIKLKSVVQNHLLFSDIKINEEKHPRAGRMLERTAVYSAICIKIFLTRTSFVLSPGVTPGLSVLCLNSVILSQQ